MSLPPLALTMGDPAGIGPEITRAAWRALRGRHPFAVIADPDHLASLGSDVPVRAVETLAEAAAVFPRALPVLAEPLACPVRPGVADPAHAPAIVRSVERAVALARSGAAAAVVTNPLAKTTLLDAGIGHTGHTMWLKDLAGGGTPVMMLAGPMLRVVPVTVHIPLAEVPRALTADAIVAAGRITAAALAADYGLAAPRLAVAGLNPHAGESGTVGREEIEVIAPAIAALQADGIDATGPHPGDSLFHAAARATYDAALCMYHDQALIPIKALDFANAVNVTLGLPIVRTSPDHGTAYGIAGKGLADPTSLIAALEMAAAIAARRGERKAA
ncbi:4-hydroxythreonine-4-phosphate dehydrogenase PdxA [Elioraea rosea]|uniref:4-hydroxythreonine-4-phosphate dehydrogenase PdxA n=1 Tax=Elioraea rosea TaxID=2492390 RepID=UPI001181C96F|nr:4-hydroxythreonine-4-phosphate dehydrogenase PdxA [Elioraea rosea]